MSPALCFYYHAHTSLQMCGFPERDSKARTRVRTQPHTTTHNHTPPCSVGELPSPLPVRHTPDHELVSVCCSCVPSVGSFTPLLDPALFGLCPPGSFGLSIPPLFWLSLERVWLSLLSGPLSRLCSCGGGSIVCQTPGALLPERSDFWRVCPPARGMVTGSATRTAACASVLQEPSSS